MRELPLGWQTDLAVLGMSGAEITGFEDHILVESPDNPGYHWGNFILVTSRTLAEDPARCLWLFDVHLPRADHVAIGLPAAPPRSVWRPFDVQIEMDEVLARGEVLRPRELPAGYQVRQLITDDDWERSLRAQLAEHVHTGGSADAAYEEFERRRIAARRRLASDGYGAFFGAFAGEQLAADLGIVVCSPEVARFQSIATVYEHRRKGLASHLLGVAGQWAMDRGARQWVILAEPHSDASRLYTSLGFRSRGERSHQVYLPHRAR